jgi:GTPase
VKNESTKKKKIGTVIILGRPNTGKSTLLNAIMSQKVAITSPLPQTTRKNSRTVFSSDKGKIMFLDTPGIIGKIDDLLGKRINKEAARELDQADVIVCLVDISRPKSEEENKVIALVRKSEVKKILVYNKIDIAKDSKDHLAEYNYLEDEFDKVISISALKEKHVKSLVSDVFELLPEKENKDLRKSIESMENSHKPKIGMSSKEYLAEIIREKAYLFLRQEIPYSVNVEVEEIIDKRKLIVIKARILTNADRYKKMIIGKRGRKIREIGFNARKELELMSQRKIFLDLEVEVDRHWAEREINK